MRRMLGDGVSQTKMWCSFIGRVALGAQRPIAIKLSRGRSVGLSVGASVCPVHCGKPANRIRMLFGIMGPGMRQVVGFGDQSTGKGTFGGEFEARHCNQWELTFAATRPSSQITLGILVRYWRTCKVAGCKYISPYFLVVGELTVAYELAVLLLYRY